jgi:photosystem II stability/assembly factor-like uncharacterized protein
MMRIHQIFLYCFLLKLFLCTHGKSIHVSHLPNGRVIKFSTSGEVHYLPSIESSSTWEPFTIDNAVWTAISSDINDENFLLSSADKGIYLSRNSGKTWSRTALDSKFRWQSVCSDDEGKNLVALAPNAPLYLSDDFGKTWNPTSTGKKTWTTIVSDSTGQYATAAASKDGIYSSFDFGKNWMKTSSLKANWIELTSDAEGHYQFAASADSGLLYSHDSGSSWMESEIEIMSWRSIVADFSGQFVAACSSAGGVYISDNFGVTYSHSALPKIGGGGNASCKSLSVDRKSREVFIVELMGNKFVSSSNKGKEWVNLFEKQSSSALAEHAGFASLFRKDTGRAAVPLESLYSSECFVEFLFCFFYLIFSSSDR